MAIEWLAGNRIRGTSTERTTTSGFGTTTAVQGGWKEIGRTTLGSAGDTIDVTSLADKRYLMILGSKIPSGTSDLVYTFNSDSASNYAIRFSDNGATDGTGTSQGRVLGDNGGATTPSFQVGYVANKSDQEKMIINNAVGQSTAGAGNAPIRRESTGKWVNTSNTISSVQGIQQEGGDLASGSEVVVLGYDPDDTHTDNFWEELADVTLSGAGTNISSGTITAKKYLWFQLWYDVTAGADANLTFNNNTTSTYALRRSANGGSDVTSTSQTGMNMQGSGAVTPVFINGFIINTSANEKLIIAHQIEQNTAGAGNAPNRREFAGKWANTSAQITELDFTTTSNNYTAGSFLKVWGSN